MTKWMPNSVVVVVVAAYFVVYFVHAVVVPIGVCEQPRPFPSNKPHIVVAIAMPI